MKFDTFRNSMGKFIIISALCFFLLITLLTISKVLIPEEAAQLFKYLVPVQSVYLSAIVKFVILDQNRPGLTEAKNAQPLTVLYLWIARIFIFGHSAVLFLLIILFATNLLDLSFLLTSVGILESLFGIYIGLIIGDMFTADSKSLSRPAEVNK